MADYYTMGVVVSDKMKNTVIVSVNNRIFHKRYKKVILKTKRYAVHDVNGIASVGDEVFIRKTKPISKTKKWEIIYL